MYEPSYIAVPKYVGVLSNFRVGGGGKKSNKGDSPSSELSAYGITQQKWAFVG